MSNSIQKSQPPQVLVDQVIGLYNQGQLEKTVSLAESLANQYPNVLILYDILGAAYMGLKNTDKTIESYQNALRLNPNNTDAYNNMGMALYDQGKFNEAVESYTKAVELEPKFADAHYNLGNALKQMGELKQAIESYKASLAINPNDAEVLLNYGNALKDYGPFDQTIEAFKNALKIDPSSSVAQANMDNAIKERAEIDKNVADYAQITKLEISSAEMFSFTGAVLKTKGYLEAAIDSYKQALKINPNFIETLKSEYSEAYYFQAISLHTRGNRKAAIASYRQAIQINPDYFLAYLNIGVDQQLVGNLDAAIDSYKQAIKINPDYAEAYYNMGNALNEKGELDAAIDNFEQAIKIKPDYAEACYNMGLAQMKKGDLDKALRTHERALKIKSNYASCYLNYETIQVQLSDASAVGNQLKSFDNEGLEALLYKNPKHQIIQSINHFLQCDYKASEGSLQSYKILVEARESKDLSEKDQLFCSAYANFINHLIKKCPIHTSFNNNKIYHIGESHCLSYAHHHLTTEQRTFCILPKITFGAKSYHFSKPEGNSVKSITQQNLNSIPNNSLVLISFGEIDCRINEGLIAASKKTGMQLAALVEKTVINYLKWFLKANLINKHRYKFFNVPTPVYNKNFPLVANQDTAKVVSLFNETLEKNIDVYSFGLIDVYRPTRAKNGFSNSLYHCDGYHLDSRILGVIERQIVQ